MHYTISKAQIERMQYILQLPNSALRSDEHNEMLAILQGLLDQPEAWQSATKGDVSKARLYFDKEEVLLPLYTHPPAPRKHITADMVTDEMCFETGEDKEKIVSVVNAYNLTLEKP